MMNFLMSLLERNENSVTMWTLRVVPVAYCNVNRQNASQTLETVQIRNVKGGGTFNNQRAG